MGDVKKCESDRRILEVKVQKHAELYEFNVDAKLMDMNDKLNAFRMLE